MLSQDHLRAAQASSPPCYYRDQGWNLNKRGLTKATAICLLSQYHLRAAHEYLCVSANRDLPRALTVGKGVHELHTRAKESN